MNLTAHVPISSVQLVLRLILTLVYQTNAMNKTIKLVLISCLSLIFASAQETQHLELFVEGESKWETGGDANWFYENGELTGDATTGDGFVMTIMPYADFVLELEFYPDKQVNSGVFIRCRENELSSTDCYELNIWDDHPNQEFRTGAVVSRTKPLQRVQTIGKWKSYKIRSNKVSLKAWINDVLVVDLEDDSLSQGFIALQTANKGRIRFRNIRIYLLEN